MQINPYKNNFNNMNKNINNPFPKFGALKKDSFECITEKNKMQEILSSMLDTARTLSGNSDFEYPEKYKKIILNRDFKHGNWDFLTGENFIKPAMKIFSKRLGIKNIIPIAYSHKSEIWACLNSDSKDNEQVLIVNPYLGKDKYILGKYDNIDNWFHIENKDHQYYVDLSKDVSFALRHQPEKCEIILDEEGYTPIDELLYYLNSTGKHGEVEKEDLEKITTMFEKKRHEIKDGKIRAYYGHSFEDKIEKTPVEPPEILYHGTSHEAAEKIMKEGITPQQRQYVHLSKDIKTATSVGLRKDHHPVLLQVDAKKAYQDGLKFYVGNEDIWLADTIPPQYIIKLDDKNN